MRAVAVAPIPSGACAESRASENANRLGAMQGAEKNTDELLEALNGALHRLQQISIDEVVSRLEALGLPVRNYRNRA